MYNLPLHYLFVHLLSHNPPPPQMTHKQPHALLKLAVAALAVALSTALPGQLHSSSSQASTSGRETGAQSQFVNQDGVTIGECSYLDEQGREIKVGFIGVFFSCGFMN